MSTDHDRTLDQRDGEAKRNPKPVEEFKIEEIKLFDEFDPRIMRIGKNLLDVFK